MKNIVLVFVVAFAFSTMAMASDIAFYVGQWNSDGWYGVEQFDHVDTIIAETGHLFKDIQQFDDNQFDEFGAWVDENTNDGEMDIIWLNGCMPSVLYQFPNVDPDGSRAEEWLDGGNMIINVGDWFAYCSFEGGSRQADNSSAGAANILDLSSGIIISADGSQGIVTPTGKEYLPSLNDPLTSDRPVILAEVQAPWEVAAIFASGGGTDDPGAEIGADPVVIHNTETGGYLAIINQASGGPGGWIDDRGLTCAEFIGNWVKNVIGLSDPEAAGDPNPEDDAVDVPQEVVLSWTPGEFAAPTNGHKVYLGESFDDVNDATGGVAQSANSYAPPQRLDFGTTYYWRVDEVNAPPTSHIEFKGDVWSFTTEPVGYPIAGENITATASSTDQEGMNPENTINGSGLDVNDLHSTDVANMWLSSDEPNGAWIEYELDKVYKLHEMWVWNANGMIESLVGFGLKDVTVEHSTNGTEYTTLGTTHEFARAPGTPDYAHNTTVDFSGTAAKYVRLTANSNWGGIMPQYGLSEVRFFSIPVFAKEPSPDSGATDVDVDVTLGFRAGREADKHDVYLSSDEQAVIDGNAPVTTVTEASFGPLSLDLGTTYYWKINEVNEAETPTTWQGDIWNFSTPEYFVVEDFEDYNDYPPDEIWSTWLDGYGVPANGATVGYPAPDWNLDEHYVETTNVHGGSQAMPFFYDNTGTATYSEGERTFAVPQDWTKAGVQTLTLWFNGTSGNTGQLYVKVKGSKVGYEGEASNLARAGWQPWNIELASFGTNLQSVTTLAIGIDGSGASGTLYFDDIRLYSYSPQFITPAEPNNAGLLGHWKFDEGFGSTAGDSSGNGNDGTLNGGPQWVAGQIGGALDFDGVDDFVFTGKSASDLGIEGNKPKTVTAWVYTRAFNNGGIFDLGNRSDGQNFCLRTLDTDNRWRTQHWGGANDHDFDYPALNLWVHFALVYDGTESTVYANGIVVSSKAANLNITDDNPFQIGCYGWQNDYFDGIIDDVRIYDYALPVAEVGKLAGRTEPFDKPF